MIQAHTLRHLFEGMNDVQTQDAYPSENSQKEVLSYYLTEI